MYVEREREKERERDSYTDKHKLGNLHTHTCICTYDIYVYSCYLSRASPHLSVPFTEDLRDRLSAGGEAMRSGRESGGAQEQDGFCLFVCFFVCLFGWLVVGM